MDIIEMRKTKGTSTGSVPLRGFAIILVLATLVLLALLSLTYIKLALIDRNIARNYMDNKRARLIAQSGVDYAIAKVQEDISGTSWQNLQDKSITINGKVEKYTESAGSTYGENRDICKVEVRDCNSMININDGLGNARVTDNTKRMLNVLGDVVGIATLGDRIINNRSPQGYASKKELLKVVNEAEFETLKNLVTTHAWQDPNVANPVPLSDETLKASRIDGTAVYPVKYNQDIDIYRFGRGKDGFGNILKDPLVFAPETVADSSSLDHAIYGLDELNTQYIEIVSRSPVNVNTTKKEVLMALLIDLQGFFTVERRRLQHPTDRQTYRFQINYCDYGPKDIEDYIIYRPFEQAGYIYTTQKLDYNPAANSGLAKDIAEEIKACRENTVSPSGINYNNLWFGGQFNTWRQFKAFCYYLVSQSLLKDDRKIFYEWLYDAKNGVWKIQTSDFTNRYISNYAMADCLIANFNPNLHLNELNPDRNMLTLVDKTDLIVNSTEFCFTPMWYFEIESEGFVLKKQEVDNIIIAKSEIEAVVRLYDAYKETTQAQFLMGTINETSDQANNKKTLEIGPEPTMTSTFEDLARENNWSGYIALPTYALPVGMGPETTKYYAQFTDRFDLYKDGLPFQRNRPEVNFADPAPGEPTKAGPYIYSSKYRLARSYKQGAAGLNKSAMSDLRNDGVYIERHATLSYPIAEEKGENPMSERGVICYWIKPSFHPEITAKDMTYFNISGRIMTPPYTYYTMGNWFSSGNPLAPTIEDRTYYYAGIYNISFLSGFTQGPEPFDGGGNGCCTRVLSHLTHDSAWTCQGTRITYLKQGQWVHLTFRWDLTKQYYMSGYTYKGDRKLANDIYINARDLMDPILGHGGDLHPGAFVTIDKYNWAINLGDITDLNSPYNNNYKEIYTARTNTCDSTIDEFYYWSATDDTSYGNNTNLALDLWKRGRYYKITSASYTSGAINLVVNRNIPFRSSIPIPDNSTESSSIDLPIKVTGVSWTWFGEDVDSINTARPDLYKKAIVKNYRNYENAESTDPATRSSTFIYPQVNVKFIKNGAELPDVYNGDAFHAVNAQELTNLKATDSLSYKIVFELRDANGNFIDAANTTLLYSSIFDDITIYYTRGTEFLSYSYFD